MKLIRLDSNPHLKDDEFPDNHIEESFAVVKTEDWSPESTNLQIKFPHFGRGTQRRSAFVVELDWLDVRRLVREYIEIGHPDALHLKRLILLANAIEGAGWSPNDPPYQEFDEILPDTRS